MKLKLQLQQKELELQAKSQNDLKGILTQKDQENKLLTEELRNSKAENRIMNDHLSKILQENASYKSKTEGIVTIRV